MNDTDFVSKEVRYHHSCRKEYINKNKSCKKQGGGELRSHGVKVSHNQQMHDAAFQKTVEYVHVYIINQGKVYFLTSIYGRHCTYLAEESFSDPSYTAQKLHKLKSFFKEELLSSRLSNKQGLILYSYKITSAEAIAVAVDYSSTIKVRIEEVALHLRKIILTESQETNLKHPLKIQDILSGESNSPQLVQVFYRVLYSGSPKELKGECFRQPRCNFHLQ